jgi:hypothetical protein
VTGSARVLRVNGHAAPEEVYGVIKDALDVEVFARVRRRKL